MTTTNDEEKARLARGATGPNNSGIHITYDGEVSNVPTGAPQWTVHITQPGLPEMDAGSIVEIGGDDGQCYEAWRDGASELRVTFERGVMWIVARTVPANAMQAKGLLQLLAAGDGLEVSPVASSGYSCEVCDAADADMWSVYVHKPAGGVDCIGDFEIAGGNMDREAAEDAAMAYAKALLDAHPNLQRHGINGELSQAEAKPEAPSALLAGLLRIQGDLQAIRDHDKAMDEAEQSPTGDDYNTIYDHALDALNALPEIIALAKA